MDDDGGDGADEASTGIWRLAAALNPFNMEVIVVRPR
jgi:hypothetical protein